MTFKLALTTKLEHFNPTQYGLALHTTSPELGLAISNFAGESRLERWDLGRDLSIYLHSHLVEFIQPQTWTDLAFITVAKGPGSFTGTRIGIVTARTLAQQLDIPLFPISTLAAMVWLYYQREITNSGEKVIAIEMSAQRNQVFTAIYQVNLTNSCLIQLLPDAVMTHEVWQQTLDNYPTSYQLIQAPNDLGESVSSLLELAYLDWQQSKRPHWSEALPFYGQHPVDY